MQQQDEYLRVINTTGEAFKVCVNAPETAQYIETGDDVPVLHTAELYLFGAMLRSNTGMEIRAEVHWLKGLTMLTLGYFGGLKMIYKRRYHDLCWLEIFSK